VTLSPSATTSEPTPRRRSPRRSSSAAFHAVVDERLRSLEKQLDEVKGRVNGLIFLIIGAVLTQVVLGLLK
jgi:hypothetical protein